MIFTEGEEPLSFWQTLSDETAETFTEECIPMKGSEMHVPENFTPIIPRSRFTNRAIFSPSYT
jgi:hypothetical protein